MALSNQVYLGAHAPDNTAAAINVIKTKPNPYEAFSKGYDDAQRQTAAKIANDTALQNYRQTVIKADLANALYPDLLKSQQAQLQARLAAYNNPQNPYASSGSGIGPINTTPAGTPAAASATVPTPAAPIAEPSGYPGNSFNGGAQPLRLQPEVPQQSPMIPGIADASQYSSGDFLSALGGGGGLGDLGGLFG